MSTRSVMCNMLSSLKNLREQILTPKDEARKEFNSLKYFLGHLLDFFNKMEIRFNLETKEGRMGWWRERVTVRVGSEWTYMNLIEYMNHEWNVASKKWKDVKDKLKEAETNNSKVYTEIRELPIATIAMGDDKDVLTMEYTKYVEALITLDGLLEAVDSTYEYYNEAIEKKKAKYDEVVYLLEPEIAEDERIAAEKIREVRIKMIKDNNLDSLNVGDKVYYGPKLRWGEAGRSLLRSGAPPWEVTTFLGINDDMTIKLGKWDFGRDERQPGQTYSWLPPTTTREAAQPENVVTEDKYTEWVEFMRKEKEEREELARKERAAQREQEELSRKERDERWEREARARRKQEEERELAHSAMLQERMRKFKEERARAVAKAAAKRAEDYAEWEAEKERRAQKWSGTQDTRRCTGTYWDTIYLTKLDEIRGILSEPYNKIKHGLVKSILKAISTELTKCESMGLTVPERLRLASFVRLFNALNKNYNDWKSGSETNPSRQPEPSDPEPSIPTNVGICKVTEPWYIDFSDTITAFELLLEQDWSAASQRTLENDIKSLRDKLASCELIIRATGSHAPARAHDITDKVIEFNNLYDKLIGWIEAADSTVKNRRLKKIIPPGKFKCDKHLGNCVPSTDDDAVSKDDCNRYCEKEKKSSVPTLDIFYNGVQAPENLKEKTKLFRDIHGQYALSPNDEATPGWIEWRNPGKKDVIKILKKFVKVKAWGKESPITNLGLANDSPEGSTLNALI